MSDSTASSALKWKISSASGGTNCVEVALSADKVLVRDSKNRNNGALQFSSASWRDFVTFSKTLPRP
jgi:hypothetical protein